MRLRTTSMVTRVAMSCPKDCAPRRGGASSSAMPSNRSGKRDTLQPEPEPEPELGRESGTGGGFEFDVERIIARGQGREGWLRDARRQVEQHRWQDPDPISRSRSERLLLAAERLEADLAAERAGNEAYQQYRAAGRMKDGRRFGGPPSPTPRPRSRRGR